MYTVLLCKRHGARLPLAYVDNHRSKLTVASISQYIFPHIQSKSPSTPLPPGKPLLIPDSPVSAQWSRARMLRPLSLAQSTPRPKSPPLTSQIWHRKPDNWTQGSRLSKLRLLDRLSDFFFPLCCSLSLPICQLPLSQVSENLSFFSLEFQLYRTFHYGSESHHCAVNSVVRFRSHGRGMLSYHGAGRRLAAR